MSIPFRNATCLVSALAVLLGMLVQASATADEQSPDPQNTANDEDAEGQVSFAREVLPVLRQKCLACHSQADAESDLILETPQSILQGGLGRSGGGARQERRKPVVCTGRAAGRTAHATCGQRRRRGTAHPRRVGVASAVDRPGGARGDLVLAEEPVNWQRLPAGTHPIYAVAISPRRPVRRRRPRQPGVYLPRSHVGGSRSLDRPPHC